jgi:hypothetical protein
MAMQPEPPPGANADEVNAWWNSLMRDERDRLIAEHPPVLGNLNGIPAELRDQINTAVMNDDLTRADDAARYRNAVQVKQGLDHDRGSDPGNQRPSCCGPTTRWRSTERAVPRSRSATPITLRTSP